MMIAVLALAGLLIAIYLSLFRLGFIGSLVCFSSGEGCEVVQFSPWSAIAGIPIPYIGLVAYSIILTTALLGARPAHLESRAVRNTLFTMGVLALGFATYNMSIEAFAIHAFCVWCATCACCAAGIFLLSLPERPHRRAVAPGGPAIERPSVSRNEAAAATSH
jgi:uncharacterized membrane protein